MTRARACLARFGGAWTRVPEPRPITAAHIIGYTLMVYAGSIALLDQHEVSVAVAGSTLTDLWGALSMTGGALAAAGCASGHWWLEREGLRALLGSCAMQLVIISHGHLGGGSLTIYGCYVLVVVTLLGVRMYRIRGRAYAPGRTPRRCLPAGR